MGVRRRSARPHLALPMEMEQVWFTPCMIEARPQSAPSPAIMTQPPYQAVLCRAATGDGEQIRVTQLR